MSGSGLREAAGGGRFSSGAGYGETAAESRQSSKRQLATEAIMTFLRQQKAPIPTVRILAHLKDHGIAFGGRQPRNALSVMLSRSKRFQAHGRQGWTLADD